MVFFEGNCASVNGTSGCTVGFFDHGDCTASSSNIREEKYCAQAKVCIGSCFVPCQNYDKGPKNTHSSK